MVGRAGFEPATHRFLFAAAYVCVLNRLGDPATVLVEVYSVSVDEVERPDRLGSSTKLSYRPTTRYQRKLLIYIFRWRTCWFS